MATTISQHYTDELLDWEQSISFYNEEMDEIEQKMLDVIRRNCIVGIAKKVNEHQTLLHQLSFEFDRLQEEIKQQEAELKMDSALVDDAFINYETEKLQAELRSKMQAAEKEYIDVKFECYNFLSETFKK